jgi:hypothetical protein
MSSTYWLKDFVIHWLEEKPNSPHTNLTKEGHQLIIQQAKHMMSQFNINMNNTTSWNKRDKETNESKSPIDHKLNISQLSDKNCAKFVQS